MGEGVLAAALNQSCQERGGHFSKSSLRRGAAGLALVGGVFLRIVFDAQELQEVLRTAGRTSSIVNQRNGV